MRPTSPGFFAVIAFSALATTVSFPSHAYAASAGSTMEQASICQTNPHVDASLQVCVTEHDGEARYRMNTVDGTQADVVISNHGMTLQQSGPDAVRVQWAIAPADANSGELVPQGMKRSVYQDSLITIDEVQEGSQPPAWIISTGNQQTGAGVVAKCTTPGCGGHIVELSPSDSTRSIDVQPVPSAGIQQAVPPMVTTCTTPGCGGHIELSPSGASGATHAQHIEPAQAHGGL